MAFRFTRKILETGVEMRFGMVRQAERLLSAFAVAVLMSFNADAVDASAFGFSPEKSGKENLAAIQKALDAGGLVTVDRPGRYLIADTMLIGSDTTLRCAPGVVFVKSDEGKKFSHIILNKGALTRTWDRNIAIDGFSLSVNGMDLDTWMVYGLRGHFAFFYVKDLKITRFRCHDLAKYQFCIHVCTFEDLLIDDVIIDGRKDGIHLGRGKRFAIRNCRLRTGDDPIALNAHDYAESNPEMGWIEDGVIENVHEIYDPSVKLGFFCRILAGAWIDWREGMEVQQSDTVVSGGRMYRFRMSRRAKGKKFVSRHRPSHETGTRLYGDGCEWTMTQTDVQYSAGCRNIVFRDIFIEQPRTAFCIYYDNDIWSRSYYPGAEIPVQKNITFDNVNVLHNAKKAVLAIETPVDSVTFQNCDFNKSCIWIATGGRSVGPTKISLLGCRFRAEGDYMLAGGGYEGKDVLLKTSCSQYWTEDFKARVDGPSRWIVDSDLPGLRKERRE